MPHFLLRQNTNDTSDQINQTEANYIILIQVQLPNLFVVHLILGSSVSFFVWTEDNETYTEAETAGCMSYVIEISLNHLNPNY